MAGTLPFAHPGLSTYSATEPIPSGCPSPDYSKPPGVPIHATSLEAVCPFCVAALPPPETGLSPGYPSVASVVHSDPYHLVITVVKVSINRTSSYPGLLASSALLFLTPRHVDAKQKSLFFLNLSIKHKKMLCLDKKERCPLDISEASENSFKFVTKLIE